MRGSRVAPACWLIVRAFDHRGVRYLTVAHRARVDPRPSFADGARLVGRRGLACQSTIESVSSMARPRCTRQSALQCGHQPSASGTGHNYAESQDLPVSTWERRLDPRTKVWHGRRSPCHSRDSRSRPRRTILRGTFGRKPWLRRTPPARGVVLDMVVRSIAHRDRRGARRGSRPRGTRIRECLCLRRNSRAGRRRLRVSAVRAAGSRAAG